MSSMSNPDASDFSTDYHTARDRFRSAVSRAGGSLTALALTTRRPEGDTLTNRYLSEQTDWLFPWRQVGATRPLATAIFS